MAYAISVCKNIANVILGQIVSPILNPVDTDDIFVPMNMNILEYLVCV